LTIFSRLVIGYVIIFALVVAANIFALNQLRQVNRVTRSFLTADSRLLDLQKKMSDSLLEQIRFEKKFVLMKDTALLEQFQKAKIAFNNEFQEAMVVADSGVLRDLLYDVGQAQARYEALVTREATFVKDGRYYDAAFFSTQKDDATTMALNNLKELRETNRRHMYDKMRHLDMATRHARSVSVATIIASVVIGVLVSVLITRSIVKPLGIMKRKTRDIAKGNFETIMTLPSPPEMTEVATAFNAMCVRLKEVDKIKSEFFSLMSHELRTPLTSIREGTTLLLEGVGGQVTEQQKRLLTIISEEDRRLIEMVNSLLDLSKMEAGMMTYNFVEGDLVTVLKQAVHEIEPLARSKNITVEGEAEKKLPPIQIDVEKVRQALRNLIANAVKFTPDGGFVKVACRRNSKSVEISVSDTGPGIPREDLQRIFEKYHQVNNGNSPYAKGTGLGLAIVHHIAVAHGGTVWAESELGHGSTFTLSLPA